MLNKQCTIKWGETWRVSDGLSLSCTSSLCVSPMITLHLWRLMEAWPCADISLLSFLSLAFIFSALLPHLSVSNSLFLSFTGQSGFVTLRHMCFCWGVFMYCVYDNMCTWELASLCTPCVMWYVICLQSEGSFNARCCWCQVKPLFCQFRGQASLM